MSCKHGNHERACDLCDAEEAQYEAGRKAGLAEAAATAPKAAVPNLSGLTRYGFPEMYPGDSCTDLIEDPKGAYVLFSDLAAATPSPVPADTAELPPLPEGKALVKSSEWEDARSKRQSFNGWRINYGDCDMHLYTADQMRDYARTALASRPAPVAEQEPVAWRIRPYDHVEQQHSDVWTLTRDPDVAAIYRSKKAIIEPLVVAAAPSQPDQSAQEVIPQSEVFAYAAKEVEKDLSGAVEIMKGGAA